MLDRRATTALLLVALIALAGCAGIGADGGDDALGGGDGSGANDAPQDATAAPESDGGGADGSGDNDANDGDQRASSGVADGQRALVRTGTVTLEVDDFVGAREAVTEAVRDLDGYVGDSSRTRHASDAGNWSTGYLVVRVPAGEFSTLLAAVRDAGEVRSAQTETRDVSDRLVDLEARLDNLRSKRDRLRKFYEQANDTRALLAVEEELSAVQGEIERLTAQKRSLEDKVAYSTLRVELNEPQPSTPTPTPSPMPTPQSAYHETPLLSAFVDSVNAVATMGRAALVTAAYALPYLLVGGPLAVGVVWVRRRRRGRGSGPTGGPPDDRE
jgi:hypothetical protein